MVGTSLFLSATSTTQAQTLPATYDLRNVDGVSLTPAIQNQSEVGDCWAFATTTALDGNLILNGYQPTSSTPPAMALSPWYLTVFNGAPGYTQNVPKAYTNSTETHPAYPGLSGGFCWMTTSYYTRGQGKWCIPDANPNPPPAQQYNITIMSGGPILISDNLKNAFPLTDVIAGKDLKTDVPPASQKVNYVLTGAYYLEYANSGRTAAQQIAAVKEAILKYGTVATGMYASGYTLHDHDMSVFKWDEAGQYEYDYNPHNKQTDGTDHVVTMIGWDDNLKLPGASAPGAWLIQNSWGAWGGTLTKDDGTFYAPYTDPNIGKKGVTAFTAIPTSEYSPFILENELGPTKPTGNKYKTSLGTGMGIVASTQATVAVSKLTSISTQTVRAIGLTSVDAQPGATKKVTVSFYNGFNAATGEFGAQYGKTQTFTFPYTGYSLFKLLHPITFEGGTVLAVKVDYNGSPIPYVWESTSDSGDTAPKNVTYFYDKTTSAWQDFATFTGTTNDTSYPGVFPVKGIVSAFAP
jgi:hypothetical protein